MAFPQKITHVHVVEVESDSFEFLHWKSEKRWYVEGHRVDHGLAAFRPETKVIRHGSRFQTTQINRQPFVLLQQCIHGQPSATGRGFVSKYARQDAVDRPLTGIGFELPRRDLLIESADISTGTGRIEILHRTPAEMLAPASQK